MVTLPRNEVVTLSGISTPTTEGIRLEILKDTITMSSNESCVNLKFKIKNCSERNLILYELNGKIILDSFGMMDPFCDQEATSPAIRLYVFDATSKPITAIHWYVNDLRNPMTRERLDSITAAQRERYLKRTVILEQMKSENLEQEVDLQEFHLERGYYFIQLLYFAGKRISNFLMEDEILLDKKRFDAEVFQGCLRSTRAVLVVK